MPTRRLYLLLASRLSLLSSGFLLLTCGLLLLGSIGAANASTAVPLRPGEIGIFTDPQGLFEAPSPAGILRYIDTLVFYVVARPGPNGLHRARFRVENLESGGYPPLYLDDTFPQEIQLAPGFEEVGGRTEEGYFDLVDTEGCLESDKPMLLLTVFFANRWGSDQFAAELVLRPYDGDYVQTQSCDNEPLRPAGWMFPYDRRRAQRTNFLSCVILIVSQSFSLLSSDHGADPGDLVTVPFSLYEWSSTCSSKERLVDGLRRDHLDFFDENYCSMPPGDPQYCTPRDSVRASLDWDDGLATVEDVRLSTQAEARGMQLQEVENTPGHLEILVEGGEGTHVDTPIFEVDYRLGTTPAIFSPAVTFHSKMYSADYNGSLAPLHSPAWIRIGCEKADVYDDDIVDATDRDAALALASGSLQADDMTHCRADLNENGEADAGDGVLFCRLVDQLGEGEAGTEACAYPDPADGYGSLVVEGAAGVELELSFDPTQQSVAFVTADHGFVDWSLKEPGLLHIVWADAQAGTVHIDPGFFAGNGKEKYSLVAVRPFDETGQEISRGSCVATQTTPVRITRLNPVHPNPFNPRTTISFDLAKAGAVHVEVYDARGRRLRSLFEGQLTAGPHELHWDGRDENGNALASGVYRVLLSTASGTQSRAAVLVK